MASSLADVRIVLTGATGNGKSSTGNSLSQCDDAFTAKQSAISITKRCKAETVRYRYVNNEERTVTIVDTPGFFDTDKENTNEKVTEKISSKIFEMTSPGVHAFLIIVSVCRFTPEQKNTVKLIQEIFGEDASKYCIVVFTREDQLDRRQTIDEFINSSPDLKKLVKKCGNRRFAIDNTLDDRHLNRKTDELLDMIDEMVENNNDEYYTNANYQAIEKQRKKEKAEKEDEERRAKKAYKKKLLLKGEEKGRKKAEEEQRRRKQESEDEESQKSEEEEKQPRRERIYRAEHKDGIICDKCGAFVSSIAAKLHLASNGVMWVVDQVVKVAGVLGKILSVSGMSSLAPERKDQSAPESGVLAELYNAHGYKCINKHSGSWVDC